MAPIADLVRKDSHFIRQRIVNKSGAYWAVLFVVPLLDRLVRNDS
jgi:hypothetical protein